MIKLRLGRDLVKRRWWGEGVLGGGDGLGKGVGVFWGIVAGLLWVEYRFGVV